MIKYIISILLIFSFLIARSQLPSGFPTQANTGWTQWGYQQSTLGTIIATRDTLWTPRYCGTEVLWPHAGVDTAYWMWDCVHWKKIVTASDISIITANNGLTKTGNNIQLGGSLIQATNITSSVGANRIIYSGVSSFGDGAQIDVSTSGSVGIAVRGQTVDGRGVLGVATTGVGVYGTATGSGGYGLFGLSTLGNAIYGRADSGLIWEGAMVPHSNNTIIPARSTTRASQALGANGIGYSDDSYLQTSTGSNRLSNQIIYKLTNATDASYASSFEFWNANNATVARKMAIAGNGQIILDQYTGTNFQTIDTSFNALVVDGSGNIFKRTGGGGVLISNASGVGDTLLISNTIKRLNKGYGINHTITSTNITQSVDTFSLSQQWGLQNIVWRRQGIVLTATVAADHNNVQEPNVIREANPIILIGTDTVFKMWYTQGWNSIGICYAESADGRTWTKYSGNPIISGYSRSSIIKNGSTYVMYAVPGVTGPRIDRFTSSNGVTFSLINTGVITQGTAGQWNDGGVFNSWIINDGGTYKMLVDGLNIASSSYADGYYTSSDGITFTQYGSNPVTYITAPFFTKIGSTFWLWGHAAPKGPFLVPTDAYRAFSSDMIHWNYDPIPYNSTFHRLTTDEGVDSINGQIGDLNLLAYRDSVYMYYDGTQNGNDSSGKLQIKLAVAEMPFASLVQTRENAPIFNSFETVGRNLFYNEGNVGFGQVSPRFPVDAITNIQANNGFVSWQTAADGATMGYNLYHRSVTPLWHLIDTTQHGTAMQYDVNDMRFIATATINTSSPTTLELGRIKRTDSTWNWYGRSVLGSAVDDGVSVLNVAGPFYLNGNATMLGTINLVKINRGGGSISDNVRVGDGSTLNANTTGSQTSAFGALALATNTTGSYNTGIGAYALNSNSTGNFNTGVGNLSAFSTTGSNNTAVGRATLYSATGDGNSAYGVNAGRSVTTGSNNTAIGFGAMYTDGTTSSTNVTGSVAIGYNSQVAQNSSGILGGLDANGFAMRWGIDMTAPSAYLHLPAGKSTAGFASFKIDSGALLSSPEKYAIEVNGSHIYWTDRTSTRFQLDQQGGAVTTLYTGDGSISANRTLTGNNKILTFDTLNYFRVNAFSQVMSWPDKTSPYTTSIIAGTKQWQIGYTPNLTFGKGTAIIIDTNNNVSLGTSQIPTTAPLYGAGSAYAGAGFQSAAGNFYRVDSISVSVPLALTMYFIRVNASSGNVTLTLPSASTAFGAGIGIMYKVQKIDGTANTVTIARSGGDLINGATSQVISSQYDLHEVQCTSTTTWAYK